MVETGRDLQRLTVATYAATFIILQLLIELNSAFLKYVSQPWECCNVHQAGWKAEGFFPFFFAVNRFLVKENF